MQRETKKGGGGGGCCYSPADERMLPATYPVSAAVMAVMTSITRTWEGKVWSTTSRRAEHASSFAGPGTCHFSQGKARERPSEGNFSSGAMSWLDRPVASFTCSFVSGCSVFLRVGSHGLGSFPSRANVPYRTKRRKRVREKTTHCVVRPYTEVPP